MKMGEYIKHLRTGGNPYGKRWSQEEIGQMLNPPVNRGAVNKWEKGHVENIKRTHIQQLATIFGVQPCDLMCFDSKYDEEQIAQEVQVIEQVQNLFGKDVVQLLQYFNELNELGRQKALNDIGDLTELPKYTVQGQSKVVQGKGSRSNP